MKFKQRIQLNHIINTAFCIFWCVQNSDKHSFQLKMVSGKLVIGMTKRFFVGLQGYTEGRDDRQVASSMQKF